MWWEGLLKYSKNYIPTTLENISVIPIRLKDKNTIAKYGDKILTMYYNFKKFCYEVDLEKIAPVAHQVNHKFTNLEDLLRFVLIDINIEFCGIFFKDTLIGFISYRIRPGYFLYILDVWIEPEYRGKGHFSNVHRLIRRIATITKCHYMDLEVHVKNLLSYKLYINMKYKAYVGTYTYLLDKKEIIQLSPLERFFVIKEITKENVKKILPDFKVLWEQYHTYKKLRFDELGMALDIPTSWNYNSIMRERLNPCVSCQIFYYREKPIGFITIVKSDKYGPCSAQINDFFFSAPYFEHFGKIVIRYIKRYLLGYKPEVQYFSMFAKKTDFFKILLYEEAKLSHRADNLFLNI